MPTYLAQIAPQRSTQYSTLAATLAPHELALCPAVEGSSFEAARLGGQPYLPLTSATTPDEAHLDEWARLATVAAFFERIDGVPGIEGPLLRPMEVTFPEAFPREMVMTRRYRGKTNELFTHFMVNVARYSSAFATKPWRGLRVLDPLAGGGTTLLVAMLLGASVAGVELDENDTRSTVQFLKQYLQGLRRKHRVEEQRLKGIGTRWTFSIGKDEPITCVLAAGETYHSKRLVQGFKKPHLVVTDLPYGVQHQGLLPPLLERALPIWADLLVQGGALAMSWDSTRFSRDTMIAHVREATSLTVLVEPPYDRLAHRVDRVIKERDVLVAVK